MAAQIARKITLRNIGLSKVEINKFIRDNKLDDGKDAPVAKVFGIAHGAKPGQSDTGEYLKLVGEFSGVNLVTGEIYSASSAILPNFISEQFEPVIAQHGNAEFSLQIGVKRVDSAATGYEFTVQSLLAPKSSNRMLEMMRLAGIETAAPVLAAPDAVAPALAVTDTDNSSKVVDATAARGQRRRSA